MVGNVRDFFSISLHWWLVTIGGICLAFYPAFSAICQEVSPFQPQQFVETILASVDNQNAEGLVEEFDRLENVLSTSINPLNEGQQFLLTFLNEINCRYELNLNIQDSCLFIKQNLPILKIPEETKKVVLYIIETFELDATQKLGSAENLKEGVVSEALSMKVSWPWKWRWFGLNKKTKKRKEIPSTPPLPTFASIDPPFPGQELPGNIYAGGVEILAGALLLIISEVCPPAAVPAWGLIGDGSRRVFDGVVEISEERRRNGVDSGLFSAEF